MATGTQNQDRRGVGGCRKDESERSEKRRGPNAQPATVNQRHASLTSAAARCFGRAIWPDPVSVTAWQYTCHVAWAASSHVQAGGGGAGRSADSAAATRPSRSSTALSVARPSSTSRRAGTSDAATGVPQASASIGGSPNPSSSEGKTSAWAPV